MKYLSKLIELSRPANFVLFLRILVYIPIFKFRLMWMKMPELLRSLDKNPGNIKPFENKDKAFSELAWEYASFIIIRCLRFKKPCLIRSLVLFYLFRKKALGVKIHFGIKQNVSPFEGHSWLSLNGTYFLEHTDPLLLHTDIYSYPCEI